MNNTYKFKIYGHEYETRVIRRDEEEIVISVNGQEYKAYMQPTKKKSMARPTPKIKRPDSPKGEGTPVTAAPGASAGANVVKAPLPGLVLKILVKQGDTVKLGDTVMVMEAMKMQNNITATAAGTVAEVNVAEGASVMEGQALLSISAG